MTVKIKEAPVMISPGEAGFEESKINTLDDHLKGLIEKEDIQCASYLLSRRGKIFAWKGLGKSHYNNPDSLFGPDAIRPITSVTKVFTATGIMQLIEEGKLHLDQEVKELIKEFDTSVHGSIRIHHLLTHTAGIRAMPTFYREPYPITDPHFKDMDSYIRYHLSGPWRTGPGEKWQYGSAGFNILGEIIRRLSGMSFEEYIKEKILIPLEMKDTDFLVPPEKRNRLGLVCSRDEENSQTPRLTCYNPGGGLYSTLEDLWKLCTMMMQKGEFRGIRILGRKTVEKMTTNTLKGVTADAWGEYTADKTYGLGWSLAYRGIVSPGTYLHEGAGRALIINDPGEELTAVVFVPSTASWIPASVLGTINIIWSGLQ